MLSAGAQSLVKSTLGRDTSLLTIFMLYWGFLFVFLPLLAAFIDLYFYYLRTAHGVVHVHLVLATPGFEPITLYPLIWFLSINYSQKYHIWSKWIKSMTISLSLYVLYYCNIISVWVLTKLLTQILKILCNF